MSANKSRYYVVSTVSRVRANNKTDALALVQRKRGVSGEVIVTEVNVDRIPAAEARA